MKINLRCHSLIIHQLTSIEKLASDLQTQLGAKYTPTAILYFNPKHDGDVTISNYAQSSSVKVLVGPSIR